MEQEPQQPFTVDVDLRKALEANHASFVLRVMWANNDLLSIQSLINMLNQEHAAHPEMDTIFTGVKSYTLLLMYSTMVEIVTAFVNNFPDQRKDKVKGSASFARFHKRHPRLSAKWKAFYKVAKAPKFSELETLRNQFGFHYNYFEDGQASLDAFAQLVEEMKSIEATQGAAIYCINSKGYAGLRYPLADGMVNRGWRRICGIDPFYSKGGAEI